MAVAVARYTLDVDPRERAARLPELAQACDAFDVRIRQLSIGDYLIAGMVVVERKTYADFATSLTDGRLFPQAAALSRSPHRPLMLVEGPRTDRLPAVHPHALQGAIASLAIMWRLPLIEVATPEEGLRLFQTIAEQITRAKPLGPAKAARIRDLVAAGPTRASSADGPIRRVDA